MQTRLGRRAALLSLAALAARSGTARAQTLPLVRIVATGGTIANSPTGRLSVESVMQRIPALAQVARIEVVDVARIGSSAITLQNWLDIAAAVERAALAEPRPAGIVVTHGSNTAEETAYFLHLALRTDTPVVVTGAQRQNDTLGEEGPRNLFDAVRVATHPEARGKGVLLAVNELVHSARDVTKLISVRVETWDSGDLGALGLIDLDQVSFYRSPTRRHTTRSEVSLDRVRAASDLPRVDILTAYADGDGALAEAAARAGARGLVIAGFPTGSPTPAMTTTLDRLRRDGVVVLMSHRGGIGRISTNNRFLSADNLTPQKARILLMLGLANGMDEAALRRLFATH
jgi:L-asparaginase